MGSVLAPLAPLVLPSYEVVLMFQGPGRWLVLNIHACDNPEQYEIKLDIIRKKINRTHDCFDFTIEIDKEIDFKYGVSRTHTNPVSSPQS